MHKQYENKDRILPNAPCASSDRSDRRHPPVRSFPRAPVITAQAEKDRNGSERRATGNTQTRRQPVDPAWRQKRLRALGNKKRKEKRSHGHK
ncbi:hypothetical protein F2P81_015978 [Scophthalmus maximus]|uniref:Uncharacterized protein n=1 Tax=Scophthalmus maximus TaxID=52904 RepID=A0A6A4SB25_SCOMX|nr:hypothetical protein F2P81_015978 [Scophthalmus maximus]